MKLKNSLNGIYTCVILVTSIMLTSCDKEESLQVQPSNVNGDVSYFSSSSVENVNGRLVFQDSASFSCYIDWAMKNQDDSEMMLSIAESNNVTSMAKIYNDGLEMEEGTKEFDSYVEQSPNVYFMEKFDGSIIYERQAPLIFAYICNKDGVYQIGEKICRVSYDHYYEIINGNESRISEIINSSQLINDNEVKSNKTQIETRDSYHGYRTVYFASNKRMVGRLRINNIGGNTWYFITNSSQKKILGVWVGNKFMRLRVCWNAGYYRDPGSSTPNSNISISAYDSGYLSVQNLERAYCISFQPVITSYSACHVYFWGEEDSYKKNDFPNGFLNY